MENASKALLIAAAVLVVIILVAVGIKISSSTSGTQKVATDTGKTISDKTGDAKDLAISEITGNKNAINYGSKTKETIGLGDEITIGTEKFKVFSVTNDEIKAMPYFNLKLDSDPIKQATAATAESAGTTRFSSGQAYWDKGQDINMDDDTNLVQPYINRYRDTLYNMGASSIKVEIARIRGFPTNKPQLANPGGKGEFWIGTGHTNYAWGILYYTINNDINYTNTPRGVRPIIIISK